MNLVHSSKNWLFAVVGGVSLAGAAAVMADREAPIEPRHAATARELSSVFREVAQAALPSVVSIETVGKPVQLTGGGADQLPFDENSPFFRFFENDPQLREFFENPPKREMPTPHGMGSGVIIDESGVILTNSHVVRGAEQVKVELHDGRTFIATEVKEDPRTDVAIVRIDAPDDLQALPMGDSDAMQIGDWVLAVGSPYGLDLTVTQGIISAKGRGPGIAEREDFLQTDAAINPGNSGGPLLNLNGEIIGINTAISSRGGGSDGIGFAIPIDMAKWVANQLIEKGSVERAYLGVSIQPAEGKLAEKFGVDAGKGAIVSQVMPKSPAQDAGFEAGDVIVSVNGEAVDGPRDLQGLVEELEIGDEYTVTVLRDGERKELTVEARQMPRNFSAVSPGELKESPSSPQEEFEDIGLQVQTLTPALAKQLNLENAKGVIVTSVENGSPAQLAGIQTGDVIEKVATKKVTSVREFRQALKDASLDEGVLMLVRSEAGTRFVVVQTEN